jgi:nitrous oxide reductase accessory protein NosL
MNCHPDRALTRRRAAKLLATGTLAGVAGCLGSTDPEGGDVPGPVDLSGGKFDYQGGMEIGPHGGPNGQIFYADNEPETPHDPGNSPEDHDNLAWFHTLAQGLFPYHFDRLDRGWEAEAVYATDYSVVDVELSGGDGTTRLPSPTAPGTFADATDLTYVAGSDVIGGMGSELVPFSSVDDAEALAADHGGRTLTFDEIDRQLIDSL